MFCCNLLCVKPVLLQFSHFRCGDKLSLKLCLWRKNYQPSTQRTKLLFGTCIWFNTKRGFINNYITNSFKFHVVFSNGSSSCLPEKMHNHTGCICLVFLHCAFSDASQNNCKGRCKVTLVAFVCLFSAVSFQMFPKAACPGPGYIGTLFAFV